MCVGRCLAEVPPEQHGRAHKELVRCSPQLAHMPNMERPPTGTRNKIDPNRWQGNADKRPTTPNTRCSNMMPAHGLLLRHKYSEGERSYQSRLPPPRSL